jgi:hypothetical protein
MTPKTRPASHPAFEGNAESVDDNTSEEETHARLLTVELGLATEDHPYLLDKAAGTG